MFGRITPEDKLRERIEHKAASLLQAELIAMEIPGMRRQLAHLKAQLTGEKVPVVESINDVVRRLTRRNGGPQAPIAKTGRV